MTAPYIIAQIDEGGYRIEDDFVRAFLFTGKTGALLVDTGLGTGDMKEVCASLTDRPVTLVHTHADPDHIGGDGPFDEILLHPAEHALFFEQTSQFGDAFLSGADVKPVPEGHVFDLGGRRFEVILIPGHTPGSIALLDRENRVLVPGDTVSEETVFMFGKARDIDAYTESLKKLISLHDAFDVYYPSHGPIPVTADVAETLLEGAIKLRARELQGRDHEREDIPALLYEYNGVSFYYANGFNTP
ncbi:MAG: MBL fold metallo-hydrolase [Clostridiales Family XIII bacterium]|jgi:glyoxylase-like metal-dependent hydrolase (beta-lactamase superfamily II)|nr:MBL fold metallo-hydrolase [Clostridiales Family XIII bacterium]